MIRPASLADLPRLLQIYADARDFMRRNGNETQWAGGYPSPAVITRDISLQQLYVIQHQDHIGGCFMLCAGPDPTYLQILQGAWGCHQPYGVIHRIAGDGTIPGILAQAVAFAQEQYAYLRIDTHKNNIPMQNALAKQGFQYRGVILTHDGTPRMAYDRI